MNQKKINMNKGAGFMLFLFCLLFFILLGRFAIIQATGYVHGHDVKDMADAKHSKKNVIEASRGTIYDRNGFPLAQDVTGYKIAAVLKGPSSVGIVEDKEETAKQLASVLDLSEGEILEKLYRDVSQVEFGLPGRNLTMKQKKQIEAMGLDKKGILFYDGKMRIYPNGDFASYVIGFARQNSDNILEGQFGIESSLNDYLHSKNGKLEYKGDNNGILLANLEPKIVEAPENGSDVYLTIDQRIQSFLEQSMTAAAEHYKPTSLIGIVAEAKTGKVLAMSSRPSYDPNKRNIEYFLNEPVSYAYEPGSTMKIFTLAAAVNEGLYNGEEYYQSGKYKVGNTFIRDHNGGAGWGSITFDEGVQRSSNVAFAILTNEKLGPDVFRQYIHRFGLDEKTGIDLPGESLNTILFDTPIQQTTTAFGQGSTVTPIQQIQAATAIANDGNMMKPYVIDRVVNPQTNEVVMEKKPELIGSPITEEAAQKVRQVLETVVTSPKGTGRAFHIEGYTVAGKTGTAQIVDPETKRYMDGKGNYLYSFLGMAPVDDPELIVYVAIKQPQLQDGEYGATPIADIFKSVMKNSLQYLKVKEEEVKNAAKLAENESVSVSDVTNKTMEAGVKAMERQQLRPVQLGEGIIQKQVPQGGDSVLKGDRILLAGTNNKMPNIIGWSLRDVMNLAHVLELEFKPSGQGYVTESSIQEGTSVQTGDVLEVKLSPPLEQQPEMEQNEHTGA